MHFYNKRNLVITFAALFIGTFFSPQTWSQERPDSAAKSESIDVTQLKEKYWAKGEESELRIVQNRLYTKEHKFELEAFGSFVSTDPFLTVKNFGGALGYHFSEYFGVNALFWKYKVQDSSALVTFQQTEGYTVNSNYPNYFYGAEAYYNPLYGKLSVFGKAIIYYDFIFSAGLGNTSTETGNYITPIAGIGQEIYLNKYLALLVQYRLAYYSERVAQKAPAISAQQLAGTRSSWNDIVSVGFSLFVDLF